MKILLFLLGFLFPNRPNAKVVEMEYVPIASAEVIVEPTNTEKLARIAKMYQNKHLSLDDSIPMEVGCAQAVSKCLKTLSDALIPPKGISGTSTMLAHFKTHNTLFREVFEPIPGRIIISPTGSSTKGFPHGHVGICTENNKILSNNSFNGLWQDKFTYKMWNDYYVRDRGFKVLYFEVI